MNWLLVCIAGLFETGFAFCLGMAGMTEGRERLLWYGGFGVALVVSMLLLMKAVQTLPVGTAYAVWTGIGAAGAAVMGMIFMKDPVTLWRIVFLITLIGSIVGLKAVSH